MNRDPILQLANRGLARVTCLRRNCPGVDPGTVHFPSLTVDVCEVRDLDECGSPTD